MKRVTLVYVFSLLIVFNIKAQNPFLGFKVSHWTTKNGLKDNNILWIHYSKEVFLWLGSYLGLTRFDGVNFKLYNTKNVSALSRYYDKKNNIKVSRKIDRFTLVILPFTFFMINIVLLSNIR